jgi:hypothetical protein
MAELVGYGVSRAAHDQLATCDFELPDLGDSFVGVYQPSMVLYSTRRAARDANIAEATWPIARPDLDGQSRRILAHLKGDTLPASLFGERGLQSSGDDVAHMQRISDTEHVTPLRVGSDIHAFRRGAASLYAAPGWFGTRLRTPLQWCRVKVLIRQTARIPMATQSDGIGFRNSILAAFEDEGYSADFLVAYLNSTPVRWCHYFRNRDARLGIPQVKIGHLRAIPAPRDRDYVGVIAALGKKWSARNAGIDSAEQEFLDETVARSLFIQLEDLTRMRNDASLWK